MWYVKHPFDCIVVGALAGMIGASTKPGYASQTAEVKGASSRTQSFQRPSWNWADVRAEECGKTEHTGGPCSRALYRPWARIQNTCHTRCLSRTEGAGTPETHGCG